MAFAEHEFKLSAPQKEGGTLRDSLKIGALRSPVYAAMLRGPPLPRPGEWIWTVYTQLTVERDWSDHGSPRAIKSRDIESWCSLRGVRLAPWELAAISRLDQAYLKSRISPAGDPEMTE